MNIKHRTSLILVSIAIAWIFDQLFYKKTPGISFPIFAGVFLIGLIWLAGREKVKPAVPSLILMAVTLFFAAMTSVREQPFLTFINILLTLTGMVLLLLTFENGLWHQYSLSDYFMGALRLTAAAFTNPIKFLSARPLGSGKEKLQPPKRITFWSVMAGILIAIPVVAALTALLAAADPIFSAKVNDFFALFKIEKWAEYLFRACYILVLAYLLIGVILHAIIASRERNLIGVEKPWFPAFLDWIQSVIVLVAVNLVFLAFVIVQFQYFFGGQSNIVINGYTFAEYARKGFNELVGVTLISLALLFALTSITKRVTMAQRRSFSGLGTLLVLLVVVILVSAYQRLMLYENAYGFTRIRLQTHVLMIWLGILLVATLVLELINKPRVFGLAVLLVSFGFGLTLNAINPDAMIVKLNLRPDYTEQELDTRYLLSLSSDAIPNLVKAFQNSNLPDNTHDQMAVILVCQRESMKQDRQDTSWQSFHFSRNLAERYLKMIDVDLNSYQLVENADGSGPSVKVGSNSINCWASMD